MLARALIVLSCLIFSHFGRAHVLAQNTAASAATSSREASGASAATPISGDVRANDNVSTSEATGTASVETESPEAVKRAVPVDREALVPASPAPARRDLESDPLFTPAVVLIGTGTAALLASLFTGLGAHGMYTSLEAECKNNICSGDKEHEISSGKALATVSTVLTGVGIASAGIGATLLILAANHDDEPPAQANFGFAKVHLTGGPTPLSIGATASF